MTYSGIRQGLTLLQNRDFARLFIVYMICYPGNAMTPIAIAFGVLVDRTSRQRLTSLPIVWPYAARPALRCYFSQILPPSARSRC